MPGRPPARADGGTASSQRRGRGGHTGERPVRDDRARAAVRLAADPGHWIPLLLAATVADVLTTAVGLSVGPEIVEGNPIPAAVLAAAGVPVGLAILAVASVVVPLLAIETSVALLEGRLGPSVRRAALLRSAGYGPLTVVTAAVALHNVVLLVETIPLA